MKLFIKNNILNMVTIFIVTMFFSCESDIKKVQQLSETSFIPTGEADTINLKYTDSGQIKSILKSPKMLDYSNITNPFTEFPKGIHVTLIDNKGNTTTVVANYAISYKKTNIIDLQGNVIISSQNGKKLETSQLYFDQKNEWFFTEKHFKYTDEAGGYLEGPGVDFSKDFKIFNMQQSSGEVNTTDK
ncbi:LPS export ABC transporter periplasmic protein LptC [Flavobacterium sasangense]|uniref:LPS export ABC transporter periplasmic protein LptC n=1 Tax=Flavobacterium sasangense TaxID=503361 RepID=UPI00047C00DF|nr:LPS export ABC transporter periplasmic protein LptC [Flavobacterium sasangense]